MEKYTVSARPVWIQKVDMRTALMAESIRLAKAGRWNNLTVQKFCYSRAQHNVIYAGSGYLATTGENQSVFDEDDFRYDSDTNIERVRFLKVRPTNEIM